LTGEERREREAVIRRWVADGTLTIRRATLRERREWERDRREREREVAAR
jgi:hypothetical protein